MLSPVPTVTSPPRRYAAAATRQLHAGQPIASLFNGYVGTTVIFALADLGYFELVSASRPLSVTRAASALRVDPDRLRSLCDAASAVGVLLSRGDSHRLTAQGSAVVELLGYFLWAVGGYGQLLHELRALATGERRFGEDVQRDTRYVARGAGYTSRRFVWPAIRRMAIDDQTRTVMDLGCGSGQLLIDVCRDRPGLSGLGVDLDARTCKLARANVKAAGLAERLSIVRDDARSVLSGTGRWADRLAKADLVVSVFMLHDLMDDDATAVRLLADLRTLCRPTARIVVVESTTRVSACEPHAPVFTLAYELVHAFMGQRLWPKARYDRMFAAAGFHIAQCEALPVPNTWLYVLSPSA